MKFIAEIKEVKIRQTASLDKEVTIKIVTSDLAAIELQKYINEEPAQFEVK